MPLPVADTEDQFEALTENDLQPGVRALAAHLRLPEPVRYKDGSLPVYALGDKVIKLYPQVYRDESQLESTVLQAVQHRLPIPTPVLHEVGESDGWAYVLMSKLDGEVLYTVWPSLSHNERLDIASQLGEALAVLHQLEPPAIEPDWDTFIKAQRENCVDRHREIGLGEHWLTQIPAFIGEEQVPRKALLHTEISCEHLLIRDGRLTGLFDFEPAMAGAPEYEFASLGFFVSQGDATILRRALESYGYQDIESVPKIALKYLILHRFGNIHAYLARRQAKANTLDELADEWFGV